MNKEMTEIELPVSADAGAQTVTLVKEGDLGSTPNPTYQRDPNRWERRHPRTQTFSFSKDGKFILNKDKIKGCFGSKKGSNQFVTQMSADPHRFVPIEKPKVKKPRAKKIAPVEA